MKHVSHLTDADWGAGKRRDAREIADWAVKLTGHKTFELASAGLPDSGMTLGIPGAGAYLNRLSALTL